MPSEVLPEPVGPTSIARDVVVRMLPRTGSSGGKFCARHQAREYGCAAPAPTPSTPGGSADKGGSPSPPSFPSAEDASPPSAPVLDTLPAPWACAWPLVFAPACALGCSLLHDIMTGSPTGHLCWTSKPPAIWGFLLGYVGALAITRQRYCCGALIGIKDGLPGLRASNANTLCGARTRPRLPTRCRRGCGGGNPQRVYCVVMLGRATGHSLDERGTRGAFRLPVM